VHRHTRARRGSMMLPLRRLSLTVVAQALLACGCGRDEPELPAATASSLSSEVTDPRAFGCPRDILVARRAETNTTISSFDPDSFTLTPITSTPRYELDAVGLNPLDGFLYGVSNLDPRSGAHAPRVVRVDREGRSELLADVPQLSASDWVAGTFLDDGTYVLGSRGSTHTAWRWAKLQIGLGTAIELVDTGELELRGSGPYAWAAHPHDGKLYGFSPHDGKLVVFDPASHETAAFERPLTQIGLQPCGVAFRASGELLLNCRSSNPALDNLYAVDPLTGRERLLHEGIQLGDSDLASCVFR